MKTKAERAMQAEERRHLDEVVRILSRWPEHRVGFACGMLGSAIALCDRVGVDAEGFIHELRRRTTRPAVLVPPKESSS